MISKVRNPVGRRPTSKEVRELIFQMVAEDPRGGAPRVHGNPHLFLLRTFVANEIPIISLVSQPVGRFTDCSIYNKGELKTNQ